ncbi:MAG: FAD-binding oxidoreductase [Eudoraea sp.]|nr:FAD-binding oxidoreductase [Eudoraea sp.]
MNLSYWEHKTWFDNVDYTIIGSGIVGLSCALALRQKSPKARILLLEKGSMPQGASTKNAGFACFGSISEILEDLDHHTPAEVLQLVQNRWDGIELLRSTLGDKAIDYQRKGGHELFFEKDQKLFIECRDRLDEVNALLKPVFGKAAFRLHPNTFGFKKIIDTYITNPFEAQINTGSMMEALLVKVRAAGVHILNGMEVASYEEDTLGVTIRVNNFEFRSGKMLVATNGFAAEWLQEDIVPARAQVMITKPIKGLKIKGTFHLDKGYYYFRNVEDRIMFGGARNLDFKTEETTTFGLTSNIQDKLEEVMRETILPNTPFEIDHRWSGIMGTGSQKGPIVIRLTDRVAYGVRLGGMGIAIGSHVGRELAQIA